MEKGSVYIRLKKNYKKVCLRKIYLINPENQFDDVFEKTKKLLINFVKKSRKKFVCDMVFSYFTLFFASVFNIKICISYS